MNRTFALLLLALSSCARAERAPPLPGDSVSVDGAVSHATPRLATAAAPSREAPSAIESRLFPADYVMEHRADLALTRPQQDAITKELDAAQASLVRLQWELQAQKDLLVKVLDDAKVDEARARQAASALMQKENAIKAAHLDLLVRIKNILSAEQQQRLRAAREADRCGAAIPGDAGRD